MEEVIGPSTPEQRGSGKSAMFPDGADRPQAMRYEYRELLTPRMVRDVLAALTAVVAVFTIIGPISTFEQLSTLRRLGYWSLWYFVAWPVCFCMSAVALYWLRDSTPRTATIGLAGATLLAAVPATGVVCTIDQLIRPECVGGLPVTYLRVLAVLMPATLLIHFIALQRVKLNGAPDRPEATERPAASSRADDAEVARHRCDHGHLPAVVRNADAAAAPEAGSSRQQLTGSAVRPAAGAAATPLTRPRSIFDRLPRKLGTDLIYVKVEDHYVKAFTPAGSGLILMKFADAVAELSAHGLQVHRSYWVSRRYMKRVIPKDGRTILRLTTGQEIPVSRTYLRAVRAALGDPEPDSAR